MCNPAPFVAPYPHLHSQCVSHLSYFEVYFLLRNLLGMCRSLFGSKLLHSRAREPSALEAICSFSGASEPFAFRAATNKLRRIAVSTPKRPNYCTKWANGDTFVSSPLHCREHRTKMFVSRTVAVTMLRGVKHTWETLSNHPCLCVMWYAA